MNHRKQILTCCAIFIGLTISGFAEDASIDRLLRKLPPPEKVVRPARQSQAESLDPALEDPLGRKAMAAINDQKYSRALGLLREVSKKYPRSVVVQGLRGSLALNLRRYPEASAAFQTAVNVEPKFSIGHFGLGASE